jgi:hypothetical protein
MHGLDLSIGKINLFIFYGRNTGNIKKRKFPEKKHLKLRKTAFYSAH